MTGHGGRSDDHELTDEQRERIRARVFGEITSDRATAPIPVSPTKRPVKRGVRWVMAAAAAIAVVAGAVAVLGQEDEPQELAISAEGPVEDLAAVAARARTLTELTFDDADRRYAHLVAAHTEVGAASPTWTEETWIDQRGTGRQVTTFDDPPPGRDRVLDRQHPNPGDPVPVAPTFPGLMEVAAVAEPTLDDLASLVDERTPVESLSPSLVDLLAWPGVSTDVRGNLYDLLDAMGFEPLGPTPDSRGRLGAGYRGPGPNDATLVFVIDPETTRPLGQSSGGPDRGGSPPPELDESPVSRTTTYLEAGFSPTAGPP